MKRSKLVVLTTLVIGIFFSGFSSYARTLKPINSLDQVTKGMEYSYPAPTNYDNKLKGKTVAILASHGVMEIEILPVIESLEARGAKVEIYGPSWTEGHITLVQYIRPISELSLDGFFQEALNKNFDLVFIPGGSWSTSVLGTDPLALEILRKQKVEKKWLAAVCTGPHPLIQAGLIKGSSVTGSPTIQTDLINAGAIFLDKNEVIDFQHKIITGKGPEDMFSFIKGLESQLIKDQNN